MNSDRDRLIRKIMSLNKPTISLQTTMDIVDAIIDEGVIVSPCKVGDRLYSIFNNRVVKGIAKSLEIVIEENKISYIVGLQFFKGIIMSKEFSFGKNIFLTKEEAEEKLKELGE